MIWQSVSKKSPVLKSKSADTREANFPALHRKWQLVWSLERHFIDREVLRIETNSRQVVPRSNHAVASVERFEGKEDVQLVSSTVKYDNGKFERISSTRRVANATNAKVILPEKWSPCDGPSGSNWNIHGQAVPSIPNKNCLKVERKSKNQLFIVLVLI